MIAWASSTCDCHFTAAAGECDCMLTGDIDVDRNLTAALDALAEWYVCDEIGIEPAAIIAALEGPSGSRSGWRDVAWMPTYQVAPPRARRPP